MSSSTIAAGATTRRIFLATLIAQTVIVVTGGAVRLTGSGLGCPTWPECAEGSYTPQPAQSEGVHKWIEFGNRLLTFVLALVVLAAIVAAIRQLRRRDPLGRTYVGLALAQLFGIVAQAVLGGVTVLTKLHPVPVAGHFILSMILIAIAATLHFRATRNRITIRREIVLFVRTIVGLAAVVVLLGVIVTGSGPHAGDERARRFGFDPRTVSWLHADAVIAFIVAAIALILIVKLTDTDRRLSRATIALLVISLAQGLIGYFQYFTGLPVILVGLHLLGACLVWVFSWRLWLLAAPEFVSSSSKLGSISS